MEIEVQKVKYLVYLLNGTLVMVSLLIKKKENPDFLVDLYILVFGNPIKLSSNQRSLICSNCSNNKLLYETFGDINIGFKLLYIVYTIYVWSRMLVFSLKLASSYTKQQATIIKIHSFPKVKIQSAFLFSILFIILKRRNTGAWCLDEFALKEWFI